MPWKCHHDSILAGTNSLFRQLASVHECRADKNRQGQIKSPSMVFFGQTKWLLTDLGLILYSLPKHNQILWK